MRRALIAVVSVGASVFAIFLATGGTVAEQTHARQYDYAEYARDAGVSHAD